MKIFWPSDIIHYRLVACIAVGAKHETRVVTKYFAVYLLDLVGHTFQRRPLERPKFGVCEPCE